MKKFAITAAALMMASAASIQAQEIFDNRWYIGGSIGATIIDEDRQAGEEWPYYGIYVGKFFSPNFSLDLRLDKYQGELDNGIAIPAGESGNIDLYGLGLVGRYYFGDHNNDWRAYGLAAVGVQQHDTFIDDGRDIYASLGLGANAYMTDNLKLGTELEARYDNDRSTFNTDNGYLDFILSFNLSYAFGERPRAVVASAPAPRPVVQPAPRPTPPPPPPPEPEVLFVFDAEVTFAFDSAEIRPGAEPELNRAAAILNDRTEIILVEVAGHTDSTGPEAYNQSLSERRAQSVTDYMVARGVDRDRMRVEGFGESQPKVSNDTSENRQINRRVVVSILDRSNR